MRSTRAESHLRHAHVHRPGVDWHDLSRSLPLELQPHPDEARRGCRNYNYTSPRYLDLCDRIVTELASHYKRAKPIFAWQIDNEFNCHMDVSYAPTDTLAFREWLRKKYRTMDALNDAWGTKFWSQTYDAWDQDRSNAPDRRATRIRTQMLDESRFVSDTVIAFLQ